MLDGKPKEKTDKKEKKADKNRPSLSLMRKRRDSNSWYSYPYDSLANCWFQPLTHTSFLGFAGTKVLHLFDLAKSFDAPSTPPRMGHTIRLSRRLAPLEVSDIYIVSYSLKNKYICGEHKNAHRAYHTHSLHIIFLLFYS